MTGTIRMQDVKGLTPGIDATRSGEIFALEGKNYLFDSIGPKSAFGNRLLLPHRIMTPEHVQGMRLKLRSGDVCFTITTQGIFKWDEPTGGWVLIYRTADTSPTPYRWTWGYLNGIMYFCHPIPGIIFYDVENDVAGRLEGTGVPQDALAICVNNGRVIAMGPIYFSWSDQSDGSSWAPRVGGAGFQKINSRIPGYPIMVTPFTRGVLTWTTGGVMRSEFTGDVEVWRHRGLNTEYRPVNSFCTLQLDDDTALVLDERGLFQSKGEAPTPYAPLFNEFLIDYLQRNNVNKGTNVRMEWDELQRHLYVSVSLSRYNAIYEKCFVLYPPMDKWGQFDDQHYGIVPLRLDTSEREDDYYAYVDNNGQMRMWLATGSQETVPTDSELNLFYPLIQKPFEQEAGGDFLTVSSSMSLNTINTILFTSRAGFYPWDGTLTVEEPVLTGLDAYVQIGYIRSEGVADDQLTEIIQVLIRSDESGDEVREGTDFNVTPEGGFDYNLEDATPIDGGVEELNYVNASVSILPTLDGRTRLDTVDLSIVATTPAMRHFSCSAVGLWSIFEIRATEVGEAFHIKTLEFTGVDAGRLL